MIGAPPRGTSPAGGHEPPDRLDSWKEIAAYLRRDVTTVQRWEKREGMPVHRHLHDKMGSVYAFRSALDAWATGRRLAGEAADEQAPARPVVAPGTSGAFDGQGERDQERGRLPRPAPLQARRGIGRRAQWAGGALVMLAAALGGWQLRGRPSTDLPNPLADARFLPLTDFGGVEQAAALSRDGRFAAFQSDRDGPMDVWVTQIGTGQFRNLTLGAVKEIVNPSVRTLGFSPDGTLVTFWARGWDVADTAAIGIWAVPLLGGQPRAYLDGAAEHDWSSDGARLVFHTPGPGDPMLVREAPPGSAPRQIFSAPPGLHAHFLTWSPDGAFVYFVQGGLPDRLDLWRIRPDGGAPERLTRHEAQVSHPVFLDDRTLLYLATDAEGAGPWIHRLELASKVSRRVSLGLDRYTSLAASADGRRLVATLAAPKSALWRVPLSGGRAEMSRARRIPLTTGDGSSPRLGPGYLLYVSSKGAGDSLWKLQDGRATELWSAPDSRIVGGPAIRRDGRGIAFSVRQGGRTRLQAVNADGSEARVLAAPLEVRGAPAWTPDGSAVTVAVEVEGTPRLFVVPADGRPPAPFVAEHSVDPVWAPSGDLVVYSGADVGTTFPLKGATASGGARPLPPVTLTRGARHLAFLPGRPALLVLRGDIRRKSLWLVDLANGAAQEMTDLGPEYSLRDFDVSPDGREIVLEQVLEHSDVVLIDLARKR